MKIEIKINGNDYLIEVDGFCHTAYKCGINAKTGEQRYAVLGYFKNLSGAVLKLCREEIGSSDDTVSLQEFAARCEANYNQVQEQLDGIKI